jgi:hypothetical protein
MPSKDQDGADGDRPEGLPPVPPVPVAADPVSGQPDHPRQAGLPYYLPAAVMLGLFIGWQVDAANGTSPWWSMGCAGGGLVVGLYLTIREALRR